MDFKNHKCVFPTDNSVYNRMKIGPKKNEIEYDEDRTKWEINRYYVKRFLPWITKWICSPYSTVEIIETEQNSDCTEKHNVESDQIVFLYSSDLTFQQLLIAWTVQVIKSKSFVEIIDERIDSKSQHSWLITLSKLFHSNSKLIIYR